MSDETSPLLRPGNAEVLEPESLIPPSKSDGSVARQGRVSAFDLTRGLICCLMAIDHTFFISGKEHPTESYAVHPDRHHLYLSSPYHYLLRFVTHTCAPGFCLLMGVGLVYFVDARMDGRSRWTSGKTARYITIRGLLFMVIGWLSMLAFRSSFHIRALLVVDIIFTLGVDFILGGLLVLALRPLERDGKRMSVTLGIAALAILLACLTMVLAGAYRESAVVQILWLSGGTQTTWYVSRFPPLSWLPIVLWGVAYGRLTREPTIARRTAIVSFSFSLILLLLFLAVRIPGRWGNLTPVHPGWFRRGAAEFFWTNKYCPDLAFMTLFTAINHAFIGIFAILPTSFPGISIGRLTVNTNQILLDIGTSPFAFYFIHFYSLLLLSLALRTAGLFWPLAELGPGYTADGLGNGLAFWAVYLVFILYMWLVCRAYGRFKAGTSVESIWRYF